MITTRRNISTGASSYNAPLFDIRQDLVQQIPPILIHTVRHQQSTRQDLQIWKTRIFNDPWNLPSVRSETMLKNIEYEHTRGSRHQEIHQLSTTSLTQTRTSNEPSIGYSTGCFRHRAVFTITLLDLTGPFKSSPINTSQTLDTHIHTQEQRSIQKGLNATPTSQ